jgi:hypothetical protein
LIYLNPSSEDEPIACEIHHVSLIDRPIYEALSYTWNTNESTGEPPQNHTIACGQFQLSVTPNLFSALQHLRKAPRDLALWVDAICINQADNFERCQQVRIMHRIYATASSVLVWFGEPEPEDIIAFDFIQKDCSFRSTLPCEAQDLSADIHGAIETGLLPPLDGAPWKALGSLLNKGWFYRVWVLQEVVAATAVSFHCSIHQVDLVAMLSLADFLAEPAVMVGPSLVATRQGLHMLNTIRSIKRLVKESRRFTNMDVFKITRLFDASDARDKSYGLMGIVQDKDIIRTNYDSPSAELFTEATIHSLVNERSFSCLSFADPSFSTEDDGLPSWVPNWSSLSSSRRPFAQEESNTWFNMATGGPKLHRTPTVCNRILTVEGSEIDVIEILGRPHKVPVATDIEGSSMRDVMIWRLRETVAWIKECEDVTKPGPPHAHSTDLADEAFWHTITLGRFPGKPLLLSECIEHYRSFQEAGDIFSELRGTKYWVRTRFKHQSPRRIQI